MNLLKAFVLLAVITLLVYWGVDYYNIYIDEHPLTGPSKATNFAIVFSGILTPIFTFLAVVIAVFAFYNQKNEYKRYMQAQWITFYTGRIDSQIETIEALMQVPLSLPGLNKTLSIEELLIDTEEENVTAIRDALITKNRNDLADKFKYINDRNIVLSIREHTLSLVGYFSSFRKHVDIEHFPLTLAKLSKIQNLFYKASTAGVLTKEQKILYGPTLEITDELEKRLHAEARRKLIKFKFKRKLRMLWNSFFLDRLYKSGKE